MPALWPESPVPEWLPVLRKEGDVKLSPAQAAVIELMRDGWELKRSMTRDGGYWLQRGEETKRVSGATAYVLWRKKQIEMAKNEFPMETYRIAKPQQ